MKDDVFTRILENHYIASKKFLLTGLPVLLFACGGQGENTGSNDAPVTHSASMDTIAIYSTSLDEIEGSFYFDCDSNHRVTTATRMVYILPPVYEDSAAVEYSMISFSNTGFWLENEEFRTYSGPVQVFYDGNAQHLAASFTLVNGEADGPVKAFDPDGELYIDRVYTTGVITQSLVDLYALNWSFNPLTASLEIQGAEQYESIDKNGQRTIFIGESIIPDTEETDNSLYSMIEKEVFDSIFKVNANPFTGTLVAYSANLNATTYEYFELSMVDGKLHGSIKLYDDWGGLTLEERFENGLLVETVYVQDESDMEGMAKPVIYLYPQQEMAVNIQLQLKGDLTHSYPKYPDGGWTVNAKQNGTLYDASGKEYYALFWEGVSAHDFTYSEGFVIAGSETEKFLETSLETIGLNRREANEFIMYWLPQMENNAYNLIHFSTAEYAEIAQLKITPAPSSVLRVMMVWSPLNKAIEIPLQDLSKLHVERKGFTVVEWGGKRQCVSESAEL